MACFRSATPLRLHKCVARFDSDSRVSCCCAADYWWNTLFFCGVKLFSEAIVVKKSFAGGVRPTSDDGSHLLHKECPFYSHSLDVFDSLVLRTYHPRWFTCVTKTYAFHSLLSYPNKGLAHETKTSFAATMACNVWTWLLELVGLHAQDSSHTFAASRSWVCMDIHLRLHYTWISQ